LHELEEVFVRADGLLTQGEGEEGDEGSDSACEWRLWAVNDGALTGRRGNEHGTGL
jgi:hypothetical protein